MKKLKLILSFVFVLGIMCLGFSFASNNQKEQAVAYDYIEGTCGGSIILGGTDASGTVLDSLVMNGGLINDHHAEKGGAVYVAKGTKFTMNGGTIKNCSALQGGAVYVENGGECYLNGGTISNCSATNGLAIYVEDGGYLELSKDFVIEDCGENYSKSIKAENQANVKRHIQLNVNDGEQINTYSNVVINDIDYFANYEDLCGWIVDGVDFIINKNNVCGVYISKVEANIIPYSHDFKEDFIYSSNCLENSYYINTCKKCYYEEYEYTQEVGPHNFDLVTNYVASNCLSTSYSSYICSYCSDTYVDYGEIGPHSWVSEGFAGHYCELCSANGTHNMIFTGAYDSTKCTELSYESYECSQCSYWYNIDGDYGPHNWVLDFSLSATCQSVAMYFYTCSHCGEELDVEGTSLGTHDYRIEVIVDATCTEQGYTIGECRYCGDLNKTYSSALGHDWVLDFTSPATCRSVSISFYTCSRCGEETEIYGTSYGPHNYRTYSDGTKECLTCGDIVAPSSFIGIDYDKDGASEQISIDSKTYTIVKNKNKEETAFIKEDDKE